MPAIGIVSQIVEGLLGARSRIGFRGSPRKVDHSTLTYCPDVLRWVASAARYSTRLAWYLKFKKSF